MPKQVRQKQRDKNGRPWTSRETQQLTALAGTTPLQQIAEHLNRTPHSIRTYAARNRISLRQTKERRGKVLGEPRTGSWKTHRTDIARIRNANQIRTHILNGTINPTELEALVARTTKIANGHPLCPACAAAPQETTTGLCHDCHRDELTRAQRELQRRRQALREYWQQTQQARRFRKDNPQIEPDALANAILEQLAHLATLAPETHQQILTTLQGPQ